MSTSERTVTTPISSHVLAWPLSWIVHYFIAVIGATIIGFVPEAFVSHLYYNTGLEPYSPMIAVTALLLGYFVAGMVSQGRAAAFVWIIGFAWMLFGIYDTTRYWSANWSPERTRWGYMLANLFGPTLRCGGSECLGELFYTTPFTASIMYSVGAYVRRRRDLRRSA